jgi:hypothetical protein
MSQIYCSFPLDHAIAVEHKLAPPEARPCTSPPSAAPTPYHSLSHAPKMYKSSSVLHSPPTKIFSPFHSYKPFSTTPFPPSFRMTFILAGFLLFTITRIQTLSHGAQNALLVGDRTASSTAERDSVAYPRPQEEGKKEYASSVTSVVDSWGFGMTR